MASPSGSNTSPVPEIIKLLFLSPIAIKASNLLQYLSVRQSLANSTAALDKFPACFSIFASNLSNKVKASAVDPANPATTSLFSIFLTLEAVLLTTVLPMLTWPSPATTTSLFFLTNTIVVIDNKWLIINIVQVLILILI